MANANEYQLIVSCQQKNSTKINLLSKNSLYGDELYIEIDGKISKAFIDFPDFEFVGDIALAQCVNNTLIFALEYGPPYIKGATIRITKKVERLDFAEKTLPFLLDTNNKSMRLIFENTGFEDSHNFLIRKTGKNSGSNKIPSPKGYTRADIKRKS